MPQTDQAFTVNTARVAHRPETYFEDEEHRPPSVTIGREAAEIFAFVRDFSNFSKFMRGLKDVRPLTEAAAHLSFDHEGSVDHCDVERLTEVTDRLVVWKTLGSSTMSHTGAFVLEPAPGGRGTVVRLKMSFDEAMPGKVRGMISYFLGRDPKNEAFINLRRLKAYLEAGEVPTTQGQPSGRAQ